MLLKEIENKIAVLTLNRPEQANALSTELFVELTRVLESLGADDTVQAVVLTAAKAKAFCAGIDLKERAQKKPGQILRERESIIRHCFAALAEFPKPVIASVNGPALGGGAELILACDIRLASHEASFGQSEIKWGMIPSCGACQRLRLLAGVGVAKELILSGRTISAAEAHRVGIYNRLLDSGDLVSQTMALAETISQHSPVALRQAKKVLDFGSGISASLEYEFEASKECFFAGQGLKGFKDF